MPDLYRWVESTDPPSRYYRIPHSDAKSTYSALLYGLTFKRLSKNTTRSLKALSGCGRLQCELYHDDSSPDIARALKRGGRFVSGKFA